MMSLGPLMSSYRHSEGSGSDPRNPGKATSFHQSEIPRSLRLPRNDVRLALSVMLALVLVGCEPPSKLPTVQMQIGNDRFTLEVADDDASRETGLMNRDSMAARHGMLFVFDHADVVGFWMKNTRIPLDIVFINEFGRVVAVKTMQPFDLRSVSSEQPAMYAIELNAGAAREVNGKVNDVLTIPPLPHKGPATSPTATAPASEPAGR